MRRAGPRPLSAALADVVRGAAPAGVLARVQACWPGAVGDLLAREAIPVAEQSGTLTVACRSAAWAQEIELMGPELVTRLNAALGAAEPPTLKTLRARVATGL